MRSIYVIFAVITAIFSATSTPANSTDNVIHYNGSNIIISGGGVVIVNGRVVSGSGEAVVGNGPAASETRRLNAYSSIKIEAPTVFHYVVSAKSSLKIMAPANILPLVTTNISDQQLVVDIKGAVVLSEPIRIEATGPNLRSVVVSGSAEIHVEGLSMDETRFKISGSGRITADGRVVTAKAKVSGSGTLDLSSLIAKDVDLDVSGSGHINAHATRAASAEVSGSGTIQVTGNPAQRSVDRSGSGRIDFK